MAYRRLGLSVIPLQGKVPSIPWQPYQTRLASEDDISRWTREGLLENVGIVCGAISHNLVVLDVDGRGIYAPLVQQFPALRDTFTVISGSRRGYHLYLHCDQLPASRKVPYHSAGHVEIRVGGQQVVAPPSLHPETRQRYSLLRPVPIRSVPNLDSILAWLGAGASQPPPASRPPLAGRTLRELIAALTAVFEARGYRRRGVWLNGPCVYPDRHHHHDQHRSFGFNTRTGYGNCFVCGSMLARDIARAL